MRDKAALALQLLALALGWWDLRGEVRAMREEVTRQGRVGAAVAAWAAQHGYQGPQEG